MKNKNRSRRKAGTRNRIPAEIKLANSIYQLTEALLLLSRQNVGLPPKQCYMRQEICNVLNQTVQDVPEYRQHPSKPEVGTGAAPVFRSQEKEAEYYLRKAESLFHTSTKYTSRARRCPCPYCLDGPYKDFEER